RRMDSHGGWLATARDLANFLVHVDGFAGKPDILQPATLTTMTTGSTAGPGYACGWSGDSAHNWWQLGSLAGHATAIIRAQMGWNWVMLVNTRSLTSGYDADLDGLFWTAYGKLAAYPAYDLF